MEKNPGIIYRTKDKQIVVARNNEQLPQYKNFRRAFVRYYENESCIEPKMLNGKKVIGVQLLCELTQIGFIE